MLCPRCTAAELVPQERAGVVIDVCRDCRGIWLDRGELERLFARDEDLRPPPAPGADWDRRPASPPPRKKRLFDLLDDLLD